MKPSNLELLGIRADGVAGSPATQRGVRFILAGDVEAFFVGQAVPLDVGRALRSAKEHAGAWQDPTSPPPALAACQRVLAAEGWSVEASSTSLVYLIEPGLRSDVDVLIERSDGAVPQWLRDANPGNWQPTEWNELLDGRLGPWTMATRGRRVVSICHTPVPMTERFAECGVWTDPELRGRGYASATTAEWARLLQGSGRCLFYGTELENRASQRVAQRLALRFLGYVVSLREARDEGDLGVHPLSVLRHRSGHAHREPNGA